MPMRTGFPVDAYAEPLKSPAPIAAPALINTLRQLTAITIIQTDLRASSARR